jgi:hypothetical protein
MPARDWRLYQIEYRENKRQKLWDYLLNHPCLDCGEADPVVLDFDHLPEFEKKTNVSKLVSSGTWSWATVEAEIAKCEVVCSNCHRRRTANRAGWFIARQTITIQPVTETV